MPHSHGPDNGNYSPDLPKLFTFCPPNMQVRRKHGSYSLHATRQIPAGTNLGPIRIHFKDGYNPIPGSDYVRIAGWSETVNDNTETPNCVTHKIFPDNNPTIDYIVEVRVLRDIQPGEEITWTYTLVEYRDAPWRNQVIDVAAHPEPESAKPSPRQIP